MASLQFSKESVIITIGCLTVANEHGYFSRPSRRKLPYSAICCKRRLLEALHRNLARSWSHFFLPKDRFLTHPFQFTANDHPLISCNGYRDSSVGIVLSCGLETGVRLPAAAKVFTFSTESRPALGPNQPPIQWVPAVKRPDREADNSLPSSAEVKNGEAVSPLPHIRHGVALHSLNTRDNFTLLHVT
jgi:hypothetical protein